MSISQRLALGGILGAGACEASAFKQRLAADPSQAYFLYVPVACERPDDPCAPVVFVHGSGQTGRRYFETWQPHADEQSFVLILPTFRQGYQTLEGGEDHTLLAIWEEVHATTPLHDEMFLSGFSGGAQFVHRFAFAHPERTRSVAAHSAGNYDAPPDPVRPIPFLVTVGLDDASRVDPAQTFVADLQAAGFEATLLEIPDVNHRLSDAAVQETLALYGRSAP